MNYQEFLDAYEADCLQALRNEPKEKGMRSWFDTQKSVIIQMRNFARRSKLDEAAIKGCLTTTVAQPVADELRKGRGVHALRDVINNLRETGWYRDEEGEETEALDELCRSLEQQEDPASDSEEATALRAFDKAKSEGHSYDLESYCAGHIDGARAALGQPEEEGGK